MSRNFKHVAIAILCLTAAYHMGSRNAGATGGTLQAFQCPSGSSYTAAAGRTLWVLDGLGLRQIGPVIPGVSPVVATSSTGSTGFAILENGDCYFTDGGDWQLYGSLNGKPTPVRQETWGQVKEWYR